MIKNRLEFEQHFGQKPLTKDDKYLQFMRMYEMQADKLRKDN